MVILLCIIGKEVSSRMNDLVSDVLSNFLFVLAGWNTASPTTVTVGTVTNPATKLINVHGKLWCSIQGNIKILNTSTLQVSGTKNRFRCCFAGSSKRSSFLRKVAFESSYRALQKVYRRQSGYNAGMEILL